MKVVHKNLAGDGGGVASYKMLLRTMASEFPEDQYVIVCLENSSLRSLAELPNVQIITMPSCRVKELSRLHMNSWGMRRIVHDTKADVVWSCNNGPYVRTGVPHVLSVVNAFQVYPWSVAQYHPHSSFTVAALRWFFRHSLRRCDAVHVEMPLMGEYVRRVSGSPQRIEVIAKAVESAEDFQPEPLPAHIQRLFRSGLGVSAFTYLYVATCPPHKNHKTVLGALKILREQGQAIRLAVSVDEELLGTQCGEDLVSDLVRTGHLLPLGWIAKEQLAALYEACQSCAMPSLLESLSSAHLEAMHWKKPQIVADLPYAHDLCGDAAIYAEAESPSDWAAKMRMVAEDSALQSRLVEAGLARVKSYPETWREVAQRMRAFLADVAGKR